MFYLKNRLLIITICSFMTTSAWSADHRDGSISQDQPADIADTYAFVNPNDTTKVVFGVTVNPIQYLASLLHFPLIFYIRLK